MSVMKSTWRVECADSACPASEVPICPEAEGMAPTEHTSMKTSTPSVIFDLETGERGYTQSMQRAVSHRHVLHYNRGMPDVKSLSAGNMGRVQTKGGILLTLLAEL